MNNGSIFNGFTRQYSLSKTLRFELRPVGKTADHLRDKGLLRQDKQRAEDYKVVKKLIDEVHKAYIEQALATTRLSDEGLQAFYDAYVHPERDIKKVNAAAEKLRKEVAEKLKDNPLNKKKGKGEDEKKEVVLEGKGEGLIDQVLNLLNGLEASQRENLYGHIGKQLERDDLTDATVQKILDDFKRFTTYLSGFNQNRANIYTDKEQSTAISFRLINENLPKYINNMRAFAKLTGQHGLDLSQVEETMAANLHGETLDNFFTLDSFNLCLTQAGIERYNAVLGGKKEKDMPSVEGINQKVNLFRQKATEKSDKKAPLLAPLYKQILSDREHTSYLPEQFKHSKEVVDAIKEFYKKDVEEFEVDKVTMHLMKAIEQLLTQTISVMDDLSGVWLQSKALTDISQQMFGAHQVIKSSPGPSLAGAQQMYGAHQVINEALRSAIDQRDTVAKKKGAAKDKEINRLMKRTYVSVAEIEEALTAYLKETDGIDADRRQKWLAEPHPIVAYFKEGKRNIDVGHGKKEPHNVFRLLEERHKAVQPLLLRDDWAKMGLVQAKPEEKAAIKDYLESYLTVLHFIKPFHVNPSEVPYPDSTFYSGHDAVYKRLNDSLVPLYNRVRSFMTRKPYSVEKFKLNFECGGNFLNGFVESVTEKSYNGTQYGGYLFRKPNKFGAYDYFLGVSANSRLFSFVNADGISMNDRSEYERLNYYQMKSTSVYGSSYPGEYKEHKRKFIATVIKCLSRNGATALANELSENLNEDITPGSIITKIAAYDQKFDTDLTRVVADSLDVAAIEKELISNVKASLASYVKRVPQAAEFVSADYERLPDIQSAVDEVAENKSFYYSPVSRKELDESLASDSKRLYLFQILNKDLRYSENRDESKRGLDNLHTMYFKQLMSASQDVFDIGKGEIFFRKASIKDKEKQTIHPKGIEFDKKNPLKKGEKSLFTYDIIKDRRFTEDKFQLHLSVQINYKEESPKAGAFNKEVVDALKAHPDVNIIGIDRGERHLAYYTVIDPQGNIKEQGTLNTVTNTHKGVDHSFDYQDKLDKMEKDRDRARKDWQSIGNIKNMKEGYLSQVVHRIAQLMIKHNAIVVFEELNKGFKRGRMKVEKQVYQKLEKMLMDKLNYLMFKDEDPAAPGGLLNAYQLTAPFESFRSMGTQTGFIFYVPAANTSKIDPATGFINMLWPKYESIPKAKAFLQQFKSIHYNSEEGWFEFVADVNDFTGEKAAKLEHSRWTICTRGDRWQYRPTQRKSEPVDVTQELEKILGDHGIKYRGGTDLIEAIVAVDNAKFFERLLWLLRLTVRMRYTDDKGSDYLLSPVAHRETGRFFDSRTAKEGEPKDPDANGAYHIALKGLLMLEKMREGEQRPVINSMAWANYVQARSQKHVAQTAPR